METYDVVIVPMSNRPIEPELRAATEELERELCAAGIRAHGDVRNAPELERELSAAGIRADGNVRDFHVDTWKWHHWAAVGTKIILHLWERDIPAQTVTVRYYQYGTTSAVVKALRTMLATTLRGMLEEYAEAVLQEEEEGNR